MAAPIDETRCRDDDLPETAQAREEALSKSRYGAAEVGKELDASRPRGISPVTLCTMQTVRSDLVEEGAVRGFHVGKIDFATLRPKVVDGAIDQPCADRVDAIHASEIEMKDEVRLDLC